MDITANTDGVTVQLHGVALTDIAEVMSAESGAAWWYESGKEPEGARSISDAEHVTRLAAILRDYAEIKDGRSLHEIEDAAGLVNYADIEREIWPGEKEG